MKKIPYDTVYPIADSLITKAIGSTDPESAFLWFDAYHAYIRACGWTDEEIDEETLRRVDNNWEPLLN